MPRVLINCLLLTSKLSGVEVYIENLIFELNQKKHSFEIFILISKSYTSDINKLNNLRIIQIPINCTNRILRIILENIYIPYCIIKYKINILHSTAYILPFFTPCKTIVTIHDIIALKFPSLCQNVTAYYFKISLPYSINKADKIITVSNTVKNDIIEYNSSSKEKIKTTYLGVDHKFYKKNMIEKFVDLKLKYNLSEKYILFVGNVEPKKNLSNLVLAFNQFKSEDKNDIKLVIAGRLAWKYDETIDIINSSQFKSSIYLIGYVEEEDLPYLYRNAILFTFVSIYEGFGIPALEAMASGVPLLVSNRGSLPEITNNLCPQVDPFDINGMSAEMHRMIENKNDDKKISEVINWSKRFTCKKMANETLDIYKNLLYNE